VLLNEYSQMLTDDLNNCPILLYISKLLGILGLETGIPPVKYHTITFFALAMSMKTLLREDLIFQKLFDKNEINDVFQTHILILY